MTSHRRLMAATKALALATMVALAGLAPSPARAQSSIKIVVNGEPITTNEINQRARFLRLVARDAGGSQLQRMAADELVEEKLKLQEAKRLKINVTEQQVDAAVASIAQRVKLAPAQFAQALGQQGIDVTTLRNRLRAQIVWQQMVLARFSRTVSISDGQIVEAIEKQRQEAAAKGKPDANAAGPRTTAEYALQQVTFVVPQAETALRPARMKEAEALRAKVTGCDSLVQAAKAYKETIVKSVGRRTEDELPDQFRGLLADTAVGKLTKPTQTPVGIEMLAVCEKREIQADLMGRSKVEGDLREKEGQIMARQYIGELRRIAVIDYK